MTTRPDYDDLGHDGTRDMPQAILTLTTCGHACWMAKQETCRCQCEGRNHGVLLENGPEKPVRKKRKGTGIFFLAAIVDDYRQASSYLRDRGCSRNDSSPFIHFQLASKSQKKWEEVKNCEFGYPYLIWVGDEVENPENGTPECQGEKCAKYRNEVRGNSGQVIMLGFDKCWLCKYQERVGRH